MDTLSPKKELGKADRCHLLRYTQTYESEGAVYKVDQSKVFLMQVLIGWT